MNKETIETTLYKIGMPARLSGFSYIVDTLMLLDKPEWNNPKWTSLYYCVGKMNNTSQDIVEAAIRYALKTTRNKNSDYKLIEHYIGYANCENSNSLMQLYHMLKSEEKTSNKTITKIMLKETLLEILGAC